MERVKPRRGWKFRPVVAALEGRALLSASGGSLAFLKNPPGVHAVRPNTPVLPFAAPLNTATFLDPTARITNGDHVVIGQKTYVGPFATLNAARGFIKIGSNSAVLDNARVNSTAAGVRGPTNVLIGDSVSVGYGAVVNGPSVLGAYGSDAKPTGIGPNALIDGAVIQPGAVVGALARVGPGVTVPSGMYVLPGANVTTNAEASDPALGKVEPVPASVQSDLSTELTRDAALAAGYTNLYQGNSATGVNFGVDPANSPNVFNGNLSAVLGTSQQPGPSTTTAVTGINFEPKKVGPQFPGPDGSLVQGLLYDFPARVTGDARFKARAHTVARRLGRSNSFRADQGQPITFAGPPSTGLNVTINSPLGGSSTSGGTQTTLSGGGVTYVVVTGAKTTTTGGIPIGTNFRANDGAVLLGGPGSSYPVGDNVTIGGLAVVQRSKLGAGAVVGPRAVVINSTVAPGQVVPPNTVLVNDKVVGAVQW